MDEMRLSDITGFRSLVRMAVTKCTFKSLITSEIFTYVIKHLYLLFQLQYRIQTGLTDDFVCGTHLFCLQYTTICRSKMDENGINFFKTFS